MTPRLHFLAGSLVCAGLLAFALYLQHYQGQEPCPLCVFQRVAYIALMAVFLVAALHGPRRAGAVVAYGAVAVLTAAVGVAIAARHVWLQYLPKDRVPACGPGLEYMMRKFPLFDLLEKVFAGSGECAEAAWRLFGLSIAEWSLAWFVVLGGFAAWTAWRAARQAAR